MADEKISVSYANGVVKEFPARDTGDRVKRMLKDYHTDDDGNVFVDLYFRDGQERHYPLHENMVLTFAGHGGAQKYGDAVAGSGYDDIDEMVWDLDKLHDRLFAGNWKAEREGGPSGESILFKALMAMARDQEGDDFVESAAVKRFKAFLTDLTPNEKRNLQNGESELKPYIDELRSPAKDASSILGKLSA